MMLFLDQRQTNNGNQGTDSNKGGDNNGEGGTHIADALVHAADNGNQRSTHHADDHADHTGADHQLAPLHRIQGHGTQHGIQGEESNADIIQQIEDDNPGADQDHIRLLTYRDAEEANEADGDQNGAQQQEGTVLTVLANLGTVHNPALQGVVDSIKEPGEYQNGAAQNGAQLAQAGVVGQIQHEQRGHDACTDGFAHSHSGRTKIVLKTQAIGIFHFFHTILSFFFIQDEIIISLNTPKDVINISHNL